MSKQVAPAAALALLAAFTTTGAAGPLPAVAPDASSSVQKIAVFGRDDRQAVPDRYDAAAQAIGILYNDRTRTVCSAFCVSDRIVATAAHCVAGGRSSNAGNFVFSRNHGRSRDTARVEGFASRSSAQNIVSGDFRMRIRPPIDAAYDWALVRMSRDICAKRSLAVRVLSLPEIMEEARANRVYQISYHRDFAQWKAAYSKPCGVARDFDNAEWSTIAPDFLSSERMILHTCDTGGASSGSPLLIDTPEGPAVVGINVGTYVRSKVMMQNGELARTPKSETVANTAVNAGAFASRIEALRSAHVLPSGRPMKELQERLQQQNFYQGKLDGTFGATLRSAIETYEEAKALPVTGLATPALLLRLSGENPSHAQAPGEQSARKR
ncbi:MAG: trypsin-like peptidase domain-containing protein [Hyphomicrobiaceae bacterium]